MTLTSSREAAPAAAAAEEISPVTIEVIKGALRSAQAEMERLLQRTAMSPVIREKQDYFCGLFDREGRLLIGTKLPILGNILGPVLEQFPISEMRPGDVYWYDDPYLSEGGVSHTPDQVFVAPIFVEGELAGFTHSWAHFLDIGGMRSGSTTPDATEIFHEGILIPPVRLYREGVLNDDLLRTFLRNSRLPEMSRGDIRAMLASVELGGRRMAELFARFGVERAHTAFDRLIEQTRSTARRRMREIFTPGRYAFTELIDTDGHGTGPIAIRMELTAEGEHLTLDATRTDDQTRGPINFIMHPSSLQMVFGVYIIAGHPELMFNEGLLDLVDEVRLREGSVISPRFPAALGQRSITLARVTSACLGLVAVARPDLALGSSSAYSANKLRGTLKGSGAPFLKTLAIAAGQGARPDSDGPDAIYFLNQQNYPLEFAEQNYPLLMLTYALNPDSGGPGRWRGGCGVVREFRMLSDTATASLRMSNVDFPAYGVAGGMCGRSGRFVLNPGQEGERRLPSLAGGIELATGDVLRIEMPGGGGFGDPFDREPARVLRDVLGGMVSAAAALEDYGVVLDPQAGTVDEPATAAWREAHRRPVAMFHRRGYFDAAGWVAEADRAVRAARAAAE
ncbi:hydantoinase B/oxoprolinase family protein [Oceanicella sp. SM1341]|uniref:hydantoinase B/oxoprolinase family protein n=1 Tax=Oceanicella sp. SM1341 TaxID=1548889 RepID=UPI000E4F43DA|nr:hydantoinase B/oxoprolinase family protein [Oceanicella sp. SM1341]